MPESRAQAGRFTGRDLSAWATPKVALPATVAVVAIASLAGRLFAGSSTSARPTRGSVATVLSDNIEWGFSDVAGLLGAVFIALLPFIQALRTFTARSTEGLSLWAWLLSTWTMIGAAVQGLSDNDSFLTWVSIPAAIGTLAMLWLFARYGNWSWRAFGVSLLLTASCGLIIQGARGLGGSFEWPLTLLGVVPITAVTAYNIVTAILTSSSRRGCSQAVHLIGAIGYTFWFIQAVQTANIAMAAVAVILASSFLVGLVAMMYLGVISDDGVSAAEVLLYRQVKTVPRAIAMHQPVFNEDGDLVDIELMWANDNWQSYRTSPIPSGGKGSQHRVRFEELLPHLRQAWIQGRSVQFFRLDRHQDERSETYNYSDDIWDAEIEVETVFVKMESGMLMEWGDDLDSKIHLGSELETQRRQADARRQGLVAKLAAQSEQTRFHMALHDNILQELYIVQIGLEAGTMTPMSTDDAERARAAVEKVSKDIRSLIEGTKNSDELLPLDARINEMLDAWSISDERVPDFEFIATGSAKDSIERLPSDVARGVFHVVKEATANAIKHANAETVIIQLSLSQNKMGALSLTARVTDDGQGIPAENNRESGLANMAQRAADIGGKLRVSETKPGAKLPGTLIEVNIPEVVLEVI